MLATVVLLLLCFFTALAAIPLILKLVPPNDVFGLHTERAQSRADIWYEVNWFAGWAVVVASVLAGLALMLYNGTLLRSFWLQLLTLVLLGGIATGASLWYEREVSVNGRRWSLRRKKKARSRKPAPGQADPRRHVNGAPAGGQQRPEARGGRA